MDAMKLVENIFCKTGAGGGVNPSCGAGGKQGGTTGGGGAGAGAGAGGAKVKTTAAERKILDAVDTYMTRATASYYHTKEQMEKEMGFTLAPPSGVLLRDLPNHKSKDVHSLVEKGLLRREVTGLGDKVSRTDVPPGYYNPPGV